MVNVRKSFSLKPDDKGMGCHRQWTLWVFKVQCTVTVLVLGLRHIPFLNLCAVLVSCVVFLHQGFLRQWFLASFCFQSFREKSLKSISHIQWDTHKDFTQNRHFFIWYKFVKFCGWPLPCLMKIISFWHTKHESAKNSIVLLHFDLALPHDSFTSAVYLVHWHSLTNQNIPNFFATYNLNR